MTTRERQSGKEVTLKYEEYCPKGITDAVIPFELSVERIPHRSFPCICEPVRMSLQGPVKPLQHSSAIRQIS